MKSLVRPSFFRMFDLLVSSTNPGMKRTRWTHDGVEFERERYSFTSSRQGLVIEIFTLTQIGRRGWSLLVSKEYWWTGPDAKPLKNLRWARSLSGERNDLFAWLRAQEAELERSLSLELEKHQTKPGAPPIPVGDHGLPSPAWHFDDESEDNG